MVQRQHERRLLLPQTKRKNYTSSSSNSDGETELELGTVDCKDVICFGERRINETTKSVNDSAVKLKSSVFDMLRPSRRRCRLRHTARMVCCIMLAPILLLMLYIPLYPNMQTRQAALFDWSYNTSRNIADYVLPDNNTAILEPNEVCNSKVFLLVVVCSSIENFAIRRTIRETWANTTHFNYVMFSKLHSDFKGLYLDPAPERIRYYREYLNILNGDTTTVPAIVPVKVYFLLGRRPTDANSYNETQTLIRNESEQYGDIIQENFIDTYNNLTLKSVLALKWMCHRCPMRAAFFVKADDDTFLNIPNLLHYLLGGTLPLYNETIDLYDSRTYRVLSPGNRLNSTKNYLGGHLFCSSRPVAVLSNKWYMPYYMYPGDKYPLYLSGAAYVMSADVVARLYYVALNTTLIHIEDVYLTGMCADKIHLQRHHNSLFNYMRAKDWCSFRGTITQHEVKDDSMLDAYLYVTNTSMYCAPPAKYMTRRLRKQIGCV
ncbi:beta-1,3-galactosyltransferase 5-like [Eurosta solidaginis]|uniref:beta-1,3-galactosyltransferase 5-like n=1 Tax=Eurosta solidaginis TaxID=178769 RepID=UPI003530B9B3